MQSSLPAIFHVFEIVHYFNKRVSYNNLIMIDYCIYCSFWSAHKSMKWTFLRLLPFDITADGGEVTVCVIVVLSANHFPAALINHMPFTAQVIGSKQPGCRTLVEGP